MLRSSAAQNLFLLFPSFPNLRSSAFICGKRFFSCVSAFYILQNPAWMRYTAGRMSSFVSYLLPKGK